MGRPLTYIWDFYAEKPDLEKPSAQGKLIRASYHSGNGWGFRIVRIKPINEEALLDRSEFYKTLKEYCLENTIVVFSGWIVNGVIRFTLAVVRTKKLFVLLKPPAMVSRHARNFESIFGVLQPEGANSYIIDQVDFSDEALMEVAIASNG